MVHKLLTALILMAVAGCAELSAERPLFAASDQAGGAPLAEGVWIAVSEDCPARHVRQHGRFPKACMPLELRREPDGAWRMLFRYDLVSNFTNEERGQAERDPGPHRFVIIPAVTRAIETDSFAPLYILELQPTTEDVSYVLVAPLGVMPATEAFVLLSLSCTDILREGPIAGITPRRENLNQPDMLTGCTATHQDAVREAARRALVENVEEMTRVRFVRARP